MEKDGFEQLKNQVLEWVQEVEKLVHQVPQTQLYAATGVVLLTIFFLISSVVQAHKAKHSCLDWA